MNNEKTLPKAWKKIDEASEIVVASSGVSKVLYIQDIGEKTEGYGYIDKITGKLYLCKTTNEDVEVTDNFVLATTLNNASRLDNLEGIKKFERSDISAQNSNGTFRIAKADIVLYKVGKIVLGEFRGNCFKDTTVNSQSPCDIPVVLPEEFYPLDPSGACAIVNAIYQTYHFEFTISTSGVLKIGYSSNNATGPTWFRETFSYVAK